MNHFSEVYEVYYGADFLGVFARCALWAGGPTKPLRAVLAPVTFALVGDRDNVYSKSKVTRSCVAILLHRLVRLFSPPPTHNREPYDTHY